MTRDPDPASRERRLSSALTLAGLFLALVVLVRFYHGAVNDQYSLEKLAAPPVDLNEAGMAELITLPGVQETLARRILEERKSGGPFRDGEDLAHRVNGIGSRKLAGMLEHATISGDGGRR